MNKVIRLIFILLLAFGGKEILAQEAAGKTEKVEIQTSAICGMCKDRLEKNMAFEKGVKSVSLDEETKIITIEFRTRKNDKEKLKKAITKVGYDADDLPADKKAYDRLPACCQKGNDPH
ncbi:MAG: MerP protein [Bacteroidetes bacterium HGW-Bacteroidetes-1]|jgi:copper chaperone CopZ|nr:MAG: MerP protein [Bacteroidetes bacterium HGW-Bacteroidetes-1]